MFYNSNYNSLENYSTTKGLNTNQGVSIVEVYKQYVQPTETESKCQQVHNYRDFLTGIQIHGYALGWSPFLKSDAINF